MIHSKKFKSINDAIGKKYQTPFVASVDGMDKILYVSPKKYNNFVIEKDNNFIKSIDASLTLSFNIPSDYSIDDEYLNVFSGDEITLYSATEYTDYNGNYSGYYIDKDILSRASEEYDKNFEIEYSYFVQWESNGNVYTYEGNLHRSPENDRTIDDKQYYALIEHDAETIYYINTLDYGVISEDIHEYYVDYDEWYVYNEGMTITHVQPTTVNLYAYEIVDSSSSYKIGNHYLLTYDTNESGLYPIKDIYNYYIDDDEYSKSSDKGNFYLYIPKNIEESQKTQYSFVNGNNTINVGETNRYEFTNNHVIDSIEYNGYTESIPNFLFTGTTSLKNAKLSNSITSIGLYAFAGNKNLTSINIPTNLKYIGDYAFAECNKLNSLDIPDSVEYLGKECFKNTNISYINIPNGISYIGEKTFYNCNNLTSVIIPETVTSIKDSAFYGCLNISPEIHDNIRTIEQCAFYGCNLSSINLSKYIDNIGNFAFANNPNISSIIVNEQNTTYDSRNNCNAIINTSIDRLIMGCYNTIIPNTVTSIAQKAFENCLRLTSITIPNSVTVIENETFKNCTSLGTVTLSNNLVSIGEDAFNGCESLSSISLPNTIREIQSGAFYNCKSLTSINIPDGLDIINATVFEGTKLTSVVVPSSVTAIMECGFCGNLSLKSVTLNEGLGLINQDAFEYTGITSLVIPSSVTYIYENSVEHCNSLTSITMKSTTPPELYGGWSTNGNSFGGSQCKIYVPYGCKTTYVGDNSDDVWYKIRNRIYELPQEETEP